MSTEKLCDDVAEHFGEMAGADDALLKECESIMLSHENATDVTPRHEHVQNIQCICRGFAI